MGDKFGKTCAVCSTEKSIDTFYNEYRECKQCNIKRLLKRYYNREKILQQRRDKCAHFKDLDNRLKALEEKLSVNNDLT